MNKFFTSATRLHRHAQKISLCFALSCFMLLSFLQPRSYAEGSKDLYPSNASSLAMRAHWLTNSQESSPFRPDGSLKVYVKAGEVVCVASSALGVLLQAKIIVKRPGGAVDTFVYDAALHKGVITSRAEELAGPQYLSFNPLGFKPYTLTAGVAEEGVWEVIFQNGDAFSETLPSESQSNIASVIQCTDGVNNPLLAAFDVSVFNPAQNAFLSGRVFCTHFQASMPVASPLTADKGFYGSFYVLTKDGYLYKSEANGASGERFSFWANNSGIVNSQGRPLYESADLAGTFQSPNPNQADQGGHSTHKLFFNLPASDLPWAANGVNNNSVWLKTSAQTGGITNLHFSGLDGTPGKGGIFPMGGYINFDAAVPAESIIDIDVNNNGAFNDPADVHFTASAAQGSNSLRWDGKNGLGQVITGNYAFNVRARLLHGAAHLMYANLSGNANGLINRRLNMANGLAIAEADTMYWNDSQLQVAQNSSSNVPAPSPVNNYSGISSIINGHSWALSSAPSTSGWGKSAVIDSWSFAAAHSSFNMPVSFRKSDLKIIALSTNYSTVCPCSNVTYTLTIKNSGSAVVGDTVLIQLPSYMSNVSLSGQVTYGSGQVGATVIQGDTAVAIISLNNNGVAEYTITGYVNAVPPGGILELSALLKVPADTYDPDTSNNFASNNDITVVLQNNIALANGTPSAYCQGGMAAIGQINGNLLSGAAYQWQYSTDSLTFNDATSGGSSQNFTPPAVGQTTWYRRKVTMNTSCSCSGGVFYSNVLKITVQPSMVNTIVAPLDICGAGDAGMVIGNTPSGGNGIYAYRWQYATGSSPFENILNANSQNYDPDYLNVTIQYRRLVYSDVCVDTSSSVQVTVHPAVDNFIDEIEEPVHCGQLASVITVSDSLNAGCCSHAWQTSADSLFNGVTTNIPGMAGLDYTLPANLPVGKHYYRRLTMTNTCVSYSNVVSVDIHEPIVNVIATAITDFCMQGDPDSIGGLLSGGNGGYLINWQMADIGSNIWTDIATANTASHNPASMILGKKFRRQVMTDVCPLNSSNEITINITNQLPSASDAGIDQNLPTLSPAAVLAALPPLIGTGQWSQVSGPSAVIFDDPAAHDATVSNLELGTYAFVWTTSFGACHSEDTVSVFNLDMNLPVDLVYFSATRKGDMVSLEWETASEENTDYFEVQRNVDNTTWKSIGRVEAKGTMNEATVYQLMDEQPLPGINQYRLVMTDLDGSTKLSEVSVVDFGTENFSVIYPSPVQNTLNVETKYWKEALGIRIIDLSGKVAIEQLVSGYHTKISTASLLPGIYFVEIVLSNGTSQRVKILKQ